MSDAFSKALMADSVSSKEHALFNTESNTLKLPWKRSLSSSSSICSCPYLFRIKFLQTSCLRLSFEPISVGQLSKSISTSSDEQRCNMVFKYADIELRRML